MASLRLNFGSERGGRQGFARTRRPIFPYPASYLARSFNPYTYPPSQEKEVKREFVSENPAIEDNSSVTLENGSILQAEKPVSEESEIKEQSCQEIEKNQEKDKKKEPKVTVESNKTQASVNEKLLALLDTSDAGLSNIKIQVNSMRYLFDEIMFKLDSFLEVLDIIQQNEERKVNRPVASVAIQKESKDTIDEVLELLQTPVFQNILRQFLVGFLTKSSTPKAPEN